MQDSIHKMTNDKIHVLAIIRVRQKAGQPLIAIATVIIVIHSIERHEIVIVGVIIVVHNMELKKPAWDSDNAAFSSTLWHLFVHIKPVFERLITEQRNLFLPCNGQPSPSQEYAARPVEHVLHARVGGKQKANLPLDRQAFWPAMKRLKSMSAMYLAEVCGEEEERQRGLENGQ